MKLEYAGSTDIGKRRSVNEDSFVTEPPLFVVADGLGGHQAGEVASSRATGVIVSTLRSLLDTGMPVEEALAESIRAANREVFSMSRVNGALAGMGTTITAAYFGDGELVIAHVGDSRAYLLDDEGLRQLTHDHTYVQHLVDIGELTPEELQIHPMKSALTRAVGTTSSVSPDVYRIGLPARGTLLLCTDGLTATVADEDIREVLAESHDPKTAVERLIALANERGGPDNITVIVVSFER